jgi:hypothetical protein
MSQLRELSFERFDSCTGDASDNWSPPLDGNPNSPVASITKKIIIYTGVGEKKRVVEASGN